MAEFDLGAVQHALDMLPLKFRGPGGVAGVVKDGKIVARRAWGNADLNRHLPMATDTRLPICSISKQFTCALLLDQLGDPAGYDARVADYLPAYRDEIPKLAELCHNQSGLRDYWALTVLHGATAEQEFRKSDALPLIAKMKTGHFAPGTAYSYCNCNFRIVSEIIESETGRDLEGLYAERIFAPAGMTTALLHPDTRAPLDGVVGYEGNPAMGYLPAENGIYWKGDAGIWASLDDMLAWECHIDAGRDDPQGLYTRISGAPQYRDGSPASYAYGLRHDEIAGVKTTGHGGALRGFRAHRLHAASERLSVVVMFNHEAMASEATSFLLHAALGQEKPATKAPDAAWDGQWLDKDQGLLVQLKTDPTGASLRYATGPSRLTAAEDGSPGGDGITLSRDGDLLKMERAHENLSVTAEALPALDWADPAPLAGRYHSAELEADLEIETRDGGSYVRFTGTLGTGPAEQIHPAGKDVWIITSRRSMDAAPPGDWTVQIRRDAAGAVSGLGLGCWLARNIAYDRIG